MERVIGFEPTFSRKRSGRVVTPGLWGTRRKPRRLRTRDQRIRAGSRRSPARDSIAPARRHRRGRRHYVWSAPPQAEPQRALSRRRGSGPACSSVTASKRHRRRTHRGTIFRLLVGAVARSGRSIITKTSFLHSFFSPLGKFGQGKT